MEIDGIKQFPCPLWTLLVSVSCRTRATQLAACSKVSSTFTRQRQWVDFRHRRHVSICSNCPTTSAKVRCGKNCDMPSTVTQASNCHDTGCQVG